MIQNVSSTCHSKILITYNIFQYQNPYYGAQTKYKKLITNKNLAAQMHGLLASYILKTRGKQAFTFVHIY